MNYNEDWSTMEQIAELEAAERLVLDEELLAMVHNYNKLSRAQRRIVNLAMKKRERIKTRNFQRVADSYKKTSKKKGYALKYKGQTRKDCILVPPDSLGWDKVNMEIMGYKLHGIKVGYIFDVT